MKKFIVAVVHVALVLVFAILFTASASAQTDSTAVDSTITTPAAATPVVTPAVTPTAPPPAPATPPPAATPKKKKQMFYGGTIGATFGDYTRISVAPMVGWKLNPRVAVGLEATYEYVEDERNSPKLTGSNYGGGAFWRIFPAKRVYAHAEFDYMSYEYQVSGQESDRNWVPFLLLGGGIVRPISPRTAMTVEVLFDVLQDEHSPYKSGEPFVSVGVGVGI